MPLVYLRVIWLLVEDLGDVVTIFGRIAGGQTRENTLLKELLIGKSWRFAARPYW